MNYIREVGIWYEQLMPRFERYMYGNGGPIIMVQVCDKQFYFCYQRSKFIIF